MNVFWLWAVFVPIVVILFLVASVLGIDQWIEKSIRDLRKQKPTAVLGERPIAGNDGIPLTGENRRRRARSMRTNPTGNPDETKYP